MAAVVFNPRVQVRRPSVTATPVDRIMQEWINQVNTRRVETVSFPHINLVETPDDYRIELAAPGLEKQDFKVTVNKDILTISVDKPLAGLADNDKLLRREFSYHQFQRSFRLPATVDVNSIQATYVQGILSLKLAKKEEARVKPPFEVEIA
jgi:HSP20 family protein